MATEKTYPPIGIPGTPGYPVRKEMPPIARPNLPPRPVVSPTPARPALTRFGEGVRTVQTDVGGALAKGAALAKTGYDATVDAASKGMEQFAAGYAPEGKPAVKPTPATPPPPVDQRTAGPGGGPGVGPETMPIEGLPTGTATIEGISGALAGKKMGVARPTSSGAAGPSVMDQLQSMYDMREQDREGRLADLAYKKAANPGPTADEMYQRRLKEREIMMDWTPTRVDGSWAKGKIAQDVENEKRLDAYREGAGAADLATYGKDVELATSGNKDSKREALDAKYGLDLARFMSDQDRNMRTDEREARRTAIENRKDVLDMTNDYLIQSRNTGYLSMLPANAAPLVEAGVQQIAGMVGDPQMAEAMVREQIDGLIAQDANKVPFESRTPEQQKALIADAIELAKAGAK